MFHDFDKYIGLDKFNLLHLNDSQVEIGSKKDRHECLGYGNIWKEDSKSLKYLLTLCGEKNIPVILETPNVHNDLCNINIL
jgi:endonuclease IV